MLPLPSLQPHARPLGYLTIVDVESTPRRFCYRLVGIKITETLRRDVTDRYFEEAYNGWLLVTLIQAHSWVVTEPYSPADLMPRWPYSQSGLRLWLYPPAALYQRRNRKYGAGQTSLCVQTLIAMDQTAKWRIFRTMSGLILLLDKRLV
jgi:hypothetical protein